MYAEYPNIELLIEKFKHTEPVQKVLAENPGTKFGSNIDIEIFSQIFPNTAGIFESGGLSGQAFIKQYITVIHEESLDMHAVCGGNQIAYVICDPNETFFADIKAHNMATIRNGAKYVRKAGK